MCSELLAFPATPTRESRCSYRTKAASRRPEGISCSQTRKPPQDSRARCKKFAPKVEANAFALQRRRGACNSFAGDTGKGAAGDNRHQRLCSTRGGAEAMSALCTGNQLAHPADVVAIAAGGLDSPLVEYAQGHEEWETAVITLRQLLG